MKSLLLIPSVLKTGIVDAVASGDHPMMDYWGLANALQDEGTVEVLDYAAVENSNDFWVKQVNKSLGKDTALAVLGFQRASEFDVVFTNGENIGIPFALLLRSRQRPPGHVTIGHRLSAGKKRLFFRVLKAHHRMNTIFVYAKTQYDLAAQNLGIETHRLQQIAFHADADFFHPKTVSSKPVDGDLISAAGLEWRDYPTLINAVRDMTGVAVRLAAASPWSKHANETEKVALPEHVQARRYAYNELRDLYAQSDMVVVPLYENDFQAGVTTLLEAMAMGKPVIVTQTTGQTDVVTHEDNGLTVAAGDVAGWQQAINRLRGDTLLRQRLGENARSWVEKNATLTLWVENIVQAMRQAAYAVSERKDSPVTNTSLSRDGLSEIPVRKK